MTSGPRGTVLIVEDDADIREAMQQVLEVEGFSVSTAGNGKEGLERLDGGVRPCVVLLDLMMPVMSGAELLQAMRRNRDLEQVPVVIVTAWPREAEGVVGSQGFLRKPVDLEALLRCLDRFCPPRSG